MLVVVDHIKVESLYKNLGGKIVKEGNLPAQMKTDEEKEAAGHEVRRFLLNYQFQMWENLVVVFLMYQEMKIDKLFFEDLEDTYYQFIHDKLPKLILDNYRF